MKLISLKIRLKSRDSFEQNLSRLGYDFGPVYFQHDRIYLPRGYKRESNFPRLILRTEIKAIDRPAHYYLILKRHITDSDVEIVNLTPVQAYVEAAQIAMQLGFELSAEVSRKRQDIKLSNTSTLYLDKVENLPTYFAKVESIIEDGKLVSTSRTSALELFKKLGESSFVEQTYFELLHRP